MTHRGLRQRLNVEKVDRDLSRRKGWGWEICWGREKQRELEKQTHNSLFLGNREEAEICTPKGERWPHSHRAEGPGSWKRLSF